MRPRFQEGQIVLRGSNWVLRYHEDRIKDGHLKRVRTTETLAPHSSYPYGTDHHGVARLRRELHDKITKILAKVNSKGEPAGLLDLGNFIEHSYFPRLNVRLQIPAGNELHIEPSTVKGYHDIFEKHVKNHSIAKIALREFTTRDGQQFLESLPQDLSHKTHLRIKNFLRGAFSWAIVDGSYQGVNPLAETKAGGQTKKRVDLIAADPTGRLQKIQDSNSHAYTLEQVAEMLDKLLEPARTVCAVAAFTGLTRSELRGLKWEDYDGMEIKVQRKVWNDYVGAPKTQAREAGVPIVEVLKKILTQYRKKFPPGTEDWMFRGDKLMRPLDLDNLSRRDIAPQINGAWRGWHAFRRGLGTRLYEAGVEDKDIQSILRHADVSTTQAYYILPNKQRGEAGLRKLAKTLRSKYGIKG